MLKKQDVVPGTVLRIKPTIKQPSVAFCAGEKSEVLPAMPLMPFTEQGDYPDLKTTDALNLPAGTILEVVGGPKSRNNWGNHAIVKVRGQEIVGAVWWCVLRANCEIYQDDASTVST